jgi:hypothetical protein
LHSPSEPLGLVLESSAHCEAVAHWILNRPDGLRDLRGAAQDLEVEGGEVVDVRVGCCGFLENKQAMNLPWFQLSPTA